VNNSNVHNSENKGKWRWKSLQEQIQQRGLTLTAVTKSVCTDKASG
jgi:hypothetical protein